MDSICFRHETLEEILGFELFAFTFIIVEGSILVNIDFNFIFVVKFAAFMANVIKYWVLKTLGCGPSEVGIYGQKVLKNFFESIEYLVILNHQF